MIALRGEAFEACWARPLALVDAANLRGQGHSTAGRAAPVDWPEVNSPTGFFLKRQQAFYCHPLWNLGLPTPTLRRECRQLRFAQSHGLSVPTILAYGEASGGRALLAVSAINDSMDLDVALRHAPAQRHTLLAQLGTSLAHMHGLRLRHGALYPKHILVRPDASVGQRIWFIDFEKARRTLTRTRCMRDDLQQLQRRASFLTATDCNIIADAYTTQGMPQARRYLAQART